MNSSALSKIFSIIFAIVAISSAFMPWLTYPVMDVSIPGYYGDGVVTSSLILISLLLFLFLKNKLRNYLPALLSFLVFLISLTKFFIKDSVSQGAEELTGPNLFIHMGTSSYYVDYGLYVLLLSSFFLTIFYLINAFVKKDDKDRRFSWYSLIGVILLALVYLLLKFVIYSDHLPNDLKTQMESKFKQMNIAITNRDADEYLTYFPDELIAANGGEAMIKKVLSQVDNNLPSSLSVNSIKILQSDSSIRGLQVLFTASLTDDNGKAYLQRILGIYSKANNAWKFVSTDNYTFEDLTKILPNLSKRLKY